MDNRADTRGNKESKLDMTDEVYERLADQLNALPNNFPRTQSGVEIRLLKKIARPEEAWMASQLGRKMESAEEISARVGFQWRRLPTNCERYYAVGWSEWQIEGEFATTGWPPF